jgi:NAD(P)-dependent dehydrogenase (short-subunit alcohol dehydrogenase family)
LVDWIAESGTEASEETSGKKESLSRLRFELIPSELLNAEPSGLRGLRFAVTDDQGAQAPAIKALFEQHGAVVDIVDLNDPLKGYQGIILLNLFSAPKKNSLIDHLGMIKSIDLEDLKWVYLISDTKGHWNEGSDISTLRHFQGYSGLFKSLDKEYENTKCRLVSLTSKMQAEEIARITLNEILNPDAPSEVIYDGGNRQILELIPSELVTGNAADSPIQLDKDGVVLVLGGAQGITSKLMLHFAQEHPCRYILVGRSPDPRQNGLEAYAALESKEEIRSFLIRQGNSRKPAEIEQETSRIYKNNQILQTLTALEQSGCVVDYTALDLRDEEGLRSFIHTVYQKYDRIDGVIHGAGLLEDKLFHSKTLDSFQRVFDTKVTPLRVLAEQLRPETQFVIFFSSIASVYGNRGQTDYAAANSVMDRYAWALKEKISGKVMAINWGPWKGAGMVSASLEKEYERRGISMIPLEDGMETFVNELKYGNESQVLIMAGSNW